MAIGYSIRQHNRSTTFAVQSPDAKHIKIAIGDFLARISVLMGEVRMALT